MRILRHLLCWVVLSRKVTFLIQLDTFSRVSTIFLPKKYNQTWKQASNANRHTQHCDHTYCNQSGRQRVATLEHSVKLNNVVSVALINVTFYGTLVKGNKVKCNRKVCLH